MTRIISVALYSRGGPVAAGGSQKPLGSKTYHWGILVSPEKSTGRDCAAYHATDKSYLDTTTYRMVNPEMKWYFEAKENIDPELSTKLVGHLVIGKVPDKATAADIKALFNSVPLPVKNQNPQQSCKTWIANAILALQKLKWASTFDVKKFMDYAVLYADERMKGTTSKEPKMKVYVPKK
ncbi:hypothetical protein S7711_01457 [Stachybotrys chartarum IBT 7711]|uniref:Uncharacterized protein n=1 Tax=Stachybotrys chartarum (strain CBS 109288 / IBT 7711) TaxID=1280523 RepID=A0A084B714_STACB|nr:hypothetical protein S7711_01457 [Stachybotrys chartarum IBT 7711]KFA55074.1 hypothetical protein S40293_03522 [Stachybotrys chartarum IBT 40293]KFA77779.1 hypothetical protein S40288_00419 [Stachybotrys chartarum IBT 40288]